MITIPFTKVNIKEEIDKQCESDLEFKKEWELLQKYKHVYCTHCKHFRLDVEETSYCLHEGECDLTNCDDSKPFSERPYYEG